ncbi:hypothetical protein CC78DRAFT_587457 [Lojkania enalia]|uniref:Uncharacterized protein n=1 Tax=Lojkania enalia TaxID=147567 RepID=A0A9P4K0Y0_9PLEO|nr:hypothetical protein CC78DRAFT_587457 [Didymosphaeria enalia]
MDVAVFTFTRALLPNSNGNGNGNDNDNHPADVSMVRYTKFEVLGRLLIFWMSAPGFAYFATSLIDDHILFALFIVALLTSGRWNSSRLEPLEYLTPSAPSTEVASDQRLSGLDELEQWPLGNEQPPHILTKMRQDSLASGSYHDFDEDQEEVIYVKEWGIKDTENISEDQSFITDPQDGSNTVVPSGSETLNPSLALQSEGYASWPGIPYAGDIEDMNALANILRGWEYLPQRTVIEDLLEGWMKYADTEGFNPTYRRLVETYWRYMGIQNCWDITKWVHDYLQDSRILGRPFGAFLSEEAEIYLNFHEYFAQVEHHSPAHDFDEEFGSPQVGWVIALRYDRVSGILKEEKVKARIDFLEQAMYSTVFSTSAQGQNAWKALCEYQEEETEFHDPIEAWCRPHFTR